MSLYEYWVERPLSRLAHTLANLEQMRSLIDNLLDTTRMWTGKLDLSMASVSVRSVVDYAMHTLKQTATTKSIALSSHITEGLSPVYADPDRMRQILVILLENAVKFTPELGLVGIKARPHERDPNFLLVEFLTPAAGLVRKCWILFSNASTRWIPPTRAAARV
jgi:signal transduction histidine kinase